MTRLRASAHRWLVLLYVISAMTAAAYRHARRARYRRRARRARIEGWPW